MSRTDIEWTRNPDGTQGKTWNPVRGCTKISPGCKNCYAETFAERWRGVPGHPYEQGFDLRLAPHKLVEPARWTKPCTIFVNSMSDLFQEAMPTRYIAHVFGVMNRCKWHTFQVLTKRADLMLKQVGAIGQRGDMEPPHIWLGVSVEDRKYGIPRIQELRRTAATVRFLSIEPLLEDLEELNLDGIHWVIVGGESGPGARPMRAEWVTSIQWQCLEQGVPFFFKQWGAWVPPLHMSVDEYRLWDAAGAEGGHQNPIRIGKGRAGSLLAGEYWQEMPERPPVTVPPHAERMAIVAEIERMAAEWANHDLAWKRPSPRLAVVA